MKATIEVTGLRKRFGRTVALDGMSFTVAPGQVTGFVGPNGAGKTTTMRVILGLDAPDEGTALVAGRPYATLHRPMTCLGSLLDAAALQPSRTGRGRLLADAPTRDLLAAVSGDRVVLRTSAPGRAAAVLQRAGADAATEGDTVTISGLAAEKVVALLGANAVPFSEVSAHRASLEEAYLELTRDAVEYRAEDARTEVPR